MEPVSVYQEIIESEKNAESKRLVMILFARPACRYASEMISDFGYMHYNTGRQCYIYAVGFSDVEHISKKKIFKEAAALDNTAWYYSDEAFTSLKQYLEYITNWEYSGDIEALILQNNPGQNESLDFTGCTAIYLERILRDPNFSFNRFMEGLIRLSRAEIQHYNEDINKYPFILDVPEITRKALRYGSMYDERTTEK